VQMLTTNQVFPISCASDSHAADEVERLSQQPPTPCSRLASQWTAWCRSSFLAYTSTRLTVVAVSLTFSAPALPRGSLSAISLPRGARPEPPPRPSVRFVRPGISLALCSVTLACIWRLNRSPCYPAALTHVGLLQALSRQALSPGPASLINQKKCVNVSLSSRPSLSPCPAPSPSVSAALCPRLSQRPARRP
jgi:hypothetical protein